MDIGQLDFVEDDPIPVSLSLTPAAGTLTSTVSTTQITTTGNLAGDITVDLTASTAGTSYTSSNTSVATVDAEGLVTAVSSGTVFITVINQGAVATVSIQVVLDSDTDADGIPDDFETANSVNPGGANVSLIAGTTASAHGEETGSEAANAIDGNPATIWRASTGGSPTFFEVLFSADTNVVQVRLVGDPAHANGAVEFFQGIFQAFDALNNELANSGDIALPGSDSQIVVALSATGARRVRFTSTGTESAQPSLSEFQIITGPGDPGSGLDLNNSADASLDFDSDGLTNLAEFNLGTSIFNADTDGDGLSDSEEGTLGSNPLNADTDGDGLTDQQEQTFGTNFVVADTDGDGLSDGIEVRIGLNPLNTNSDNDIPIVLDGFEDTDGDGIINIDEVAENTDPGNPDTDGDGVSDGEELTPGADGFITDPLRPDTDGDGLLDNVEIQVGLDPTDPSDADIDSDGDGIINRDEVAQGTDPFNADTVSLAVAQVDPADNLQNVSRRHTVLIRFREPLRADALATGTVTLSQVDPGGNIPILGATSLSNDRYFISFRPESILNAADFILTVDGFKDTAGNPMTSPFQSTFSTVLSSPTSFSPNVRRFSIPNGQTDVPVNSAFVVEFNKHMDPTTLTSSNFQVKRQGVPVAGTFQTDPDEKRVAFIPTTTWQTGSSYTVTLTDNFFGNIVDVNRSSLHFGTGVDSVTTSFTTSTLPDNVAPNLSDHFPAESQPGIPLNGVVVLDFDEPLADGLDFLNLIQLKIGTVRVDGSFALFDSNRRVIFTPGGSLMTDTSYTVEIAAGITDRAGNVSTTPSSFTFETGNALVGERVAIFFEPPDGTLDVPINTQVAFELTDAFIPLTVNEETFTVWESLPSPVLRIYNLVPGTIELSPDSLSATITPTINLEALSLYDMQITTVLDQAGRSPIFRLPADQFDTGSQTDLVSPSVLLVSPPDGFANIPVNSVISVRLDEPVRLQDSGENPVVVSTGGVPVEGTISFNAERDEITFTPSVNLNTSTSYAVVVDGFSDSAGNPVQLFNSTFTTSSSPVPDVTEPQVISISPVDGAIDVDPFTQIVVTFDELVDPFSLNVNSMKITDEFGSPLGDNGTYAVNGTQVVFTRPIGFPSDGRTINVILPNVGPDVVRDLAGNLLSTSFSSGFVVVIDGGGGDD